MIELLGLFMNGIARGALYALVALAFVVIFRATGILNFALGSFLLAGSYTVASLSTVNFYFAFLASVIVVALLSIVVERFLVRPMRRQTVLAITMMTMGVDLVLMTLGRQLMGTRLLPIADPFGAEMVRFGGVAVPAARVAALIVAGLVIAAFFAWFRLSSWGIAFRAATERRDVAILMGIRLDRLSIVAWLIAALLAATAGYFLSTFPTPGSSPDIAAIALRAFPAAMIGGLDSPFGALVGGLTVGVAETLIQGYQQQLWFLGGGVHVVATYAIMIVVLWVRPAGLFGTTGVNRA